MGVDRGVHLISAVRGELALRTPVIAANLCIDRGVIRGYAQSVQYISLASSPEGMIADPSPDPSGLGPLLDHGVGVALGREV
jgi:hypothetical protein